MKPGRTTLRVLALAAHVAVACLSGGGDAAAAVAADSDADAKAEARRHFDIGVQEAKAGSYQGAIVEFLRAYDLRPHYAVLYNIAAAHLALGDPASAVTYYERYLIEGGAAIPADRRAKTEAELKKQAVRTGQIILELAPATGRVSLNGVSVAGEGAQRALRVNIGAHRLAVAADGYTPFEKTVTVASGDLARMAVALVPLAAAAGPPPSSAGVGPAAPGTATTGATSAAAMPGARDAGGDPASVGRTQRTLGYLLGGLGLVGAGAGALFYLSARSDWKAATNRGCNQEQCLEPGLAYWQDAQSGVTRSRIAFATGGALLVAGIITVLTAPSAAKPPPVTVGLLTPAPGITIHTTW